MNISILERARVYELPQDCFKESTAQILVERIGSFNRWDTETPMINLVSSGAFGLGLIFLTLSLSR